MYTSNGALVLHQSSELPNYLRVRSGRVAGFLDQDRNRGVMHRVI